MNDLTDDERIELSVTAPNLLSILTHDPPRTRSRTQTEDEYRAGVEETRRRAREELTEILRARTARYRIPLAVPGLFGVRITRQFWATVDGGPDIVGSHEEMTALATRYSVEPVSKGDVCVYHVEPYNGDDPADRADVERELNPICELCIDPIDKPHVDEHGTKRWRACPNKATREVRDEKGRPLRVCEEHFEKGSS